MIGLKRTAIIILCVGIILCSAPVIIYFARFGNEHLATDTSVWGVFGDFIGGTLNPIIGILNLALLLSISIYVARFDSHRQFNEFRYNAYVEISKKFEKTELKSSALSELKDYTEEYKFHNQFLFPKTSNAIFNTLMNDLIKRTDELIRVIEDYEEQVRLGNITVIDIPVSLGRELEEAFKDWPKTETDQTIALKNFSNSKKSILGFIQIVMIEGDLAVYKKKPTN